MPNLERYARQIVLPEIGITGQQKLAKSKVLVLGLGGLGAQAALCLAGAGIGTIGLLDRDHVEESNLHRQFLYNQEMLGWPKVKAAAHVLSKLNPETKCILHQTNFESNIAQSLLPNYDLVIDGLDTYADKFLLNDLCVSLGIPLVHGGAVGWTGQVLSIIPKQGHNLRRLLPEIPQEQTSCQELGVIGPLAASVGSMQALEAVKILLGLPSAGLIAIDALKGNFRNLKV